MIDTPGLFFFFYLCLLFSCIVLSVLVVDGKRAFLDF